MRQRSGWEEKLWGSRCKDAGVFCDSDGGIYNADTVFTEGEGSGGDKRYQKVVLQCAVCIQKRVSDTGLCLKPQVLAGALAILAAGSVLALSVSVLQEIGGQTAVTSLEREEDHNNVYWETLQVQRENGEVVDITVEVPGRQYTKRRNGKVAGPRRRRTGADNTRRK